MNHHHRVTDFSNTISYVDYGFQHDSMLVLWLKKEFNLTVICHGYEFACWIGDFDLDIPAVSDDTIFGAALEYGSCYDSELFDKLVQVELGTHGT